MQLLKKIGAITIADALTKMLGYILLPVYLGLMPQVEYGEFGFLTSAIGGISLILSLSLYVPFIRNYCSQEGENNRQSLVSTIFISVLLWLVTTNFFLIALFKWTIEVFGEFFSVTESVAGKYYLSIILINTGVVMLYCYSLLMARNNTKEIVGFIINKFITASLFGILLLYINPFNQDSVFNRLLSLAIAELIILLIYMTFFFETYFTRLSFDKEIIKSNLRVAIPIVPSAIIGLFLTVVDRRFITEYHGLIDLAIYNLALQILAPMQMVMSAVQVAWAPHLYSIKDKLEAIKISMRLMRVTFFGMVLSAILMIALSHILIRMEYIGAEYSEVISILVFAFPGVIAASLIQINNNLFIKFDHTYLILLLSSIAFFVNLGMNFILVPNFSFYGAAIAGIASNMLSLVVGIRLLYKLKLNIKND